MTALALTLTAAILGAMSFFAFFVAPAAGRSGSSQAVLQLSRAVFPRAFDLFALLSALAALLSALGGAVLGAGVLIIAACAFLWAGWSITPTLEKARDAARAGNLLALKTFRKARSQAVRANAVQYIALLMACGFLAFG